MSYAEEANLADVIDNELLEKLSEIEYTADDELVQQELSQAIMHLHEAERLLILQNSKESV